MNCRIGSGFLSFINWNLLVWIGTLDAVKICTKLIRFKADDKRSGNWDGDMYRSKKDWNSKKDPKYFILFSQLKINIHDYVGANHINFNSDLIFSWMIDYLR